MIVAASLAAELLAGGERRAVGLLAASGSANATQRDAPMVIDSAGLPQHPEQGQHAAQTVHVEPQPGQAQLWAILSALAPVEPCDVSLAELLYSSREALGRRRTLIVVTPQVTALRHVEQLSHRVEAADAPGAEVQEADGADGDSVDDRPLWPAELVHLRSAGLDSSVLLITPAEDSSTAPGVERGVDALRGLLAGYDIGCQALRSDNRLQSLLTFRRTRRVIRSTPTGGVVSYEVEEEVG